MEEIRTVIRDQGLKNTQLLEVMAKQQSEAQAAAAAAMISAKKADRGHFRYAVVGSCRSGFYEAHWPQ